MSEKFRKTVNYPHKAFGRARQKIMQTHPKKWYGKTAKTAGLTMTGLGQLHHFHIDQRQDLWELNI